MREAAGTLDQRILELKGSSDFNQFSVEKLCSRE